MIFIFLCFFQTYACLEDPVTLTAPEFQRILDEPYFEPIDIDFEPMQIDFNFDVEREEDW